MDICNEHGTEFFPMQRSLCCIHYNDLHDNDIIYTDINILLHSQLIAPFLV